MLGAGFQLASPPLSNRSEDDEQDLMRALRKIPGLIFGLAFAGGGLFILSQTALPTWQDWYAMQSWQPARARLLSVSGSENKTEARYQYQVNGATYQGDRVYVAAFSDNIGSYHSDMLTRLGNQERTDEPIGVWVNPIDPQQSVIDRDMRWGLFVLMSGFCSIFIFVGLLISYASVTSKDEPSGHKRPSLSTLRKEWNQKRQDPNFNDNFLEYSRYRVAELKRQTKDETETETIAWQTRKGWETANIRSGAKKSVFVMWGFAIVWSACSSSMLFVVPEEVEQGNTAALFGLLFPLVGIFLLYKAVTTTLEYRRFGTVLVDMDPFPGAIGGHVGGRIKVSRLAYNTAIDPSTHLSVRLECVYSYMSGSGDKRSRTENIKWAEQGQPRIESAGQGVTLSFRFDVPDNLPEADVDQTDDYHFWRLTAKAEIEGVDLNRQYNLPVFNTGKTSRFVRHDVSAQVSKRKQQESEAAKSAIERGDFDLPGLSRAMRISEQGGEIRMAFPMFRNKVLTVFAGIFAGAFGFGSYMMIGTALEGGVFGLLIGLFSLPFLLVAVAASVATIYLPLNNLRVHIRRNQISVIRRLAFIPVFSRQFAVTDISHLTIKRSGSTGQGVDKTEHFKVLAHDNDSKSMTIAEDLDGEDVAAHFRDYLARRLNVASGPDLLQKEDHLHRRSA
jgi:hypothetical protein